MYMHVWVQVATCTLYTLSDMMSGNLRGFFFKVFFNCLFIVLLHVAAIYYMQSVPLRGD